MTGPAEVVVVGSVNLDLAVRVPRIPGPGETLLATGIMRSEGGKGANQAVAAARAGGAVTSFIGCVGDDADGERLRAALIGAGVRADLVRTVAGPTGTALISVDDHGENAIVVVPGANSAVGAPDPAQAECIAAATVVLAQLEIPQDAVLAAARARRTGALLVLNAAPSAALTEDLWAEVDVLVVNEHEARDLTGSPVGLDAVLAALLVKVPAVLVTLGAAGSVLARRAEALIEVPAPRVTALDTTAAGDTFCGAFAAALARGQEHLEAVRFASAAASIAVERPGAQTSVPTMAEASARRDACYGIPGGHGRPEAAASDERGIDR